MKYRKPRIKGQWNKSTSQTKVQIVIFPSQQRVSRPTSFLFFGATVTATFHWLWQTSLLLLHCMVHLVTRTMEIRKEMVHFEAVNALCICTIAVPRLLILLEPIRVTIVYNHLDSFSPRKFPSVWITRLGFCWSVAWDEFWIKLRKPCIGFVWSPVLL